MTRTLLTGLAVLLTVCAYVVALLVVGFLSCGISGCGGGGFGPSYSPGETQVGLLVSGLLLVPAALLVAGGRSALRRLLVGTGATVAGALLAAGLSGLALDGCPTGVVRAGDTCVDADER